MKNILKVISLIMIGVITSCSSLTFYRSYNYSFMPSKYVDFSTGKWLINPSPIKLDFYEETFKKLIGNRMEMNSNLEDTQGRKHIIPEIKNPPTKQILKLLYSITKNDYFLFCSTNNNSKEYHSETTTYDSTIEIYDLRNTDLIFKGSCSVVEEFSDNTILIDLQKSTLKKLLNKIN